MSPVDMPMEVPGERTLYAILTAGGAIRGAGRSAGTLYRTEGAARNKARSEGDSVIRVTINLRQEPVFIRGLKL